MNGTSRSATQAVCHGLPRARVFLGGRCRLHALVLVGMLGIGLLEPLGAQESLPLVAPKATTPCPSSPKKPPSKPDVPPPQKGTPQELLALLGMEQSHLQSFQDGVPLGREEEEFLVRYLYCAGRFRWHNFHQWQRPLARHYQELLADPARQRGNVFSFQGRLLGIEPKEVIPELARRIGIARYYLCRVRLQPQQHVATVVLRELPPGWDKKPPVQDRVAARGLFVKLEATPPDDPRPVFVAQHLAWYPDDFLGHLGVDAAALRRSRARGPFVAQDRLPFYQLLLAVQKLSWEQLQAQRTPGEQIAQQNPRFAKYRNQPQVLKAPAFWILTLLERPGQFRGSVLSVRGTVRRAVRIEVTDPDIRTHYGIQRYWEVEIFVDPGPRIQLFGQTVAYYPVVACVARLPPGFPEGENLHETVALEGVFFKVWAYYSALGMKQRPQQVLQKADRDRDGRLSLVELAQYMQLSPRHPRVRERFDWADRDRSRLLDSEELQWLLGMQNAPLLVAPTLRWLRQPPAGSGTAGWIGGALLLVALLGLAVVLWKTHRRDDELTQTLRRHLLEEEPAFPEPDAPATPPPHEPPAEEKTDSPAET